MSAIKEAGEDNATWPWSATWPLFILTLISVFNYLDRALLGLVLPMIKREFGVSDTALGLATGLAFIFLYSLLGLPIAWLADRFNRRNIIAIGLGFWSLMTVLTGFVTSIWQLAIARFLMGAGEACGLPPSNSIIADLFHPRRRPLALAIFGTANSIAFIVFFPIAGWIAQNHGWRAMFVAMGVPGMIVALLLLLTVREPARKTPPRTRAAVRHADIRRHPDAVRRQVLRLDFRGRHPDGGERVGGGAWTPTFFSRVHHMGLAEIAGTIGPTRGFIGAAGVLCGGLLIDRLPASRIRWRLAVPALACLLAAGGSGVPARFGPRRLVRRLRADQLRHPDPPGAGRRHGQHRARAPARARHRAAAVRRQLHRQCRGAKRRRLRHRSADAALWRHGDPAFDADHRGHARPHGRLPDARGPALWRAGARIGRYGFLPTDIAGWLARRHDRREGGIRPCPRSHPRPRPPRSISIWCRRSRT
jgi:MFS family permease